MSETFGALILAAGKGVRMQSALPKVLHPILGKPMVSHVIETTRAAGATDVCVVVGFGKDLLMDALKPQKVTFVEQSQQLGTGHAVQCFSSRFPTPPAHLLVVCGDTPLLSLATLKAMATEHFSMRHACTMMTLEMAEPGGYGRILRDKRGRVKAIREAKDCSAEERKINEVNMAVYLFNGPELFRRLPALNNNNKQQEYYLTDMIEMLADDNLSVATIKEKDESSTLGINSRKDLAKVTGILKNRVLEELMAAGVTIVDPSQTLIEQGVSIGPDSMVWPGTTILGNTKIGPRSSIGPNCMIRDSQLGEDLNARFCVIENAVISNGTHIQPFSRISGKSDTNGS